MGSGYLVITKTNAGNKASYRWFAVNVLGTFVQEVRANFNLKVSVLIDIVEAFAIHEFYAHLEPKQDADEGLHHM